MKSSFKKTIVAYSLFLALEIAWAADHSNHEIMDEQSENEAFDSHRMAPSELIREMYNSSRILVLGETNHENITVYERLMELLITDLLNEKMGDSSLRYLFLERSHDHVQFFKEISTQGLTHEHIASRIVTLSDKGEVDRIRGWGMNADCYFFREILPMVNLINSERKILGHEPLEIVPIDGARPRGPIRDSDERYQLDHGPLKDSNGQIHDEVGPIHQRARFFDASWDRENDTNHNFQLHLKEMKSGQKAIVLYHLGHVYQGVYGQMPKVNLEEKVLEVPPKHPSTWLGMALQEVPELRREIKIILFDEKDKLWAPEGTFKFVERQAHRYPGISFSIPFDSMRGKVRERGMDALKESALIRQLFGGLKFGDAGIMHQSKADVADMADAVVWTASPRSAEEYQRCHEGVEENILN